MDVDAEGSESQVILSKEVWFSDGNLVVQAENTLFKVFRGILTHESALFHDMLSLPQPQQPDGDQTSSEMYEGCAVVKLQDDARDIQILLAALHHHDFLDHCPISAYVVLLRMAPKYQAERLRVRVVRTLRYLYPDSLLQYDSVTAYGRFFPTTHPLFRLPLDDLNTHLDVIIAAESAGASVLLPVAMLRVFSRGMDQIVQGQAGLALQASHRNTILAAIPKLAELSRSQSFASLYSAEVSISQECKNVAKCQQVQHRLRQLLETPATAYVIDPFAVFQFAKGKVANDLCASCFPAFRTSYKEGRARAWQKLPCIFGLAEWADLRTTAENFAAADA